MKRIIFGLCILAFFKSNGQDTLTYRNTSPYNVKPAIDIPITVAGGILSYVGLEYVLNKKSTLDSAYLSKLTPQDVNRFDRSAVYNHSTTANTYSDIALYSSFVLPVGLLFDRNIRNDGAKIGLLYLETMSIMGVAYTWGVGLMDRKRPYVYNPNIPIHERMGKGTKDSFFAGHPAAAAAATFFAAKVYNDYHPESTLKYVIWGAAVIPPAVVSYFRYEYGYHFYTDILVGVPLGAAIGILVPHFHKFKKKDSGFSLTPLPNGLSASYKF